MDAFGLPKKLRAAKLTSAAALLRFLTGDLKTALARLLKQAE
jgi:hypothetical protein